MPNLDPWFDPKGSQLLAQNSHYGLSGLLQEKGWLGWPLWSSATASVVLVSQN
jgi:hypothetical protein